MLFSLWYVNSYEAMVESYIDNIYIYTLIVGSQAICFKPSCNWRSQSGKVHQQSEFISRICQLKARVPIGVHHHSFVIQAHYRLRIGSRHPLRSPSKASISPNYEILLEVDQTYIKKKESLDYLSKLVIPEYNYSERPDLRYLDMTKVLSILQIEE